MKSVLRVTKARLRPERLMSELSGPRHGGVASFVGVVRDHSMGRKVSAVSYELDARLTLKVFQAMAAEARRSWGRDLAVGIVHRHGRLKVGEASVAIVAASAHRREALEACSWLIEELKKRAPVWKKEHYVSGGSVWLKGCTLRH